VVELRSVAATVVTCLAEAAALEAAASGWPGVALRVAPDEALLLGVVGEDPAPAAEAALALDADALVEDATEGWSIWRLEGDGATQAFARISQIPAPSGFAQGDVAHVPAKVVGAEGFVDVLVPAMSREAVRDRILHDCRDLGIRERPDPLPWTAGGRDGDR
jgi:hypothetical protein